VAPHFLSLVHPHMGPARQIQPTCGAGWGGERIANNAVEGAAAGDRERDRSRRQRCKETQSTAGSSVEPTDRQVGGWEDGGRGGGASNDRPRRRDTAKRAHSPSHLCLGQACEVDQVVGASGVLLGRGHGGNQGSEGRHGLLHAAQTLQGLGPAVLGLHGQREGAAT
jgi:hypothetical protein